MGNGSDGARANNQLTHTACDAQFTTLHSSLVVHRASGAPSARSTDRHRSALLCWRCAKVRSWQDDVAALGALHVDVGGLAVDRL